MTDKDEAESSGDEGRTIVDGRKKKNYAWPPGVYDAIIELKKKDPKRPINDDFLKSVNKRCKSGISVNGVNSWWCRHQRKVKVEKAGTSASPGVQKEKGKKRKAALPSSSEDSVDSDEKEGANGDRVDLTTANELVAAAQKSLIEAKVRLNPTSQTHTPKY